MLPSKIVALAAGAALAAYLIARRRRRSKSLLILDGGCGLELKKRKAEGHDVAYNLTLFSTAAVRDTPDGVIALHRDYIKSGCTVITTASYAVTRFYLDKIGEGERVAELAHRSVALAKAARTAENADGRVLIAASVPPLGESYQAAPLPPSELEAQYKVIIGALSDCDVYLCETMGTLKEALLASRLCQQASSKPIWVSFNPRRADESEVKAAGGWPGGLSVRVSADGTTVSEAVEALCATGYVEAVLFNCATPELIECAITEATNTAKGRLRVGGYANFWEELDTRGWSIEKNESGSGSGDQKKGGMVVRKDLSHERYAKEMFRWVHECGASIVGGCCGIGPETMGAVCEMCS